MGCCKSSSKSEVLEIQVYLRKPEKSQVNNLTLPLKELVKEQIKPKISGRYEIINFRAEISEIETK